MAKKTDDTKAKSKIDKAVILIVALLLTFSVGFVVGDNSTADDSAEHTDISEHDESDHDTDEHAEQEHSMFLVSADEAPTVRVEVTEDAKSGWNVKLVTTKFEFTPDEVNGENVVGHGHAHLYVDGEQVGRLYGPDFHFNENFDGSKVFRVTLNANDHSEYTLDNEVIEATVTVTHDAHGEDEHSH